MRYSNTEVERASGMRLKGNDMYAQSNIPHNKNSLHRLEMNVNPHDTASKGSSSHHHVGQQPIRCANCDIDILWAPIVVQGTTYCCTGCAAGGPCNCDYSQYYLSSLLTE